MDHDRVPDFLDFMNHDVHLDLNPNYNVRNHPRNRIKNPHQPPLVSQQRLWMLNRTSTAYIYINMRLFSLELSLGELRTYKIIQP
jgi:hypothetical protein